MRHQVTYTLVLMIILMAGISMGILLASVFVFGESIISDVTTYALMFIIAAIIFIVLFWKEIEKFEAFLKESDKSES